MKKYVSILMAVCCVALFSACGSKSSETTEEDAVIGELGLFELQGPVKECVWGEGDATMSRTFDQNGFWTSFNGQSLETVYPEGIQRDEQGRIIAGVTDADGNGEEYTYNEFNKIASYNYHEFDTTEQDTYTYDENGNLQKKHVEQGGMDAEEPYDETYDDVTTDDHGNWISRHVTTNTGNGWIETRTITYYEKAAGAEEAEEEEASSGTTSIGDTPTEVVITFLEAYKVDNHDVMISCMSLDKAGQEKAKKKLQQLASNHALNGLNHMDYEITEEKVEGSSAIVKFRHHGIGDKMKLKKINGQWKITKQLIF